MKANKFFAIAMMACAALMISCNPEQPGGDPEIKKDTPDVPPTEGAVTVVWNIANIDEMCDDIQYVFAGNYNNYDTSDPNAMARFEAIPDYKGWYKTVIVLPEGVDHLEGKPNALAKDGTFSSSWDFQWIGIENHPCEIVGGNAELQTEYDVESKLVCAADADVVFIKSYGFKTNPCVEAVYDEVTFNLTVEVPVTDGGVVYIVGDAFEKSWDNTAYPMNGSGANWSITLPAIVGKSYKFCVNANWDNDQMVFDSEKACVKKADNMKVDFVQMNPTVYGFMNFGLTADQVCEEETPQPVEGVMFIKHPWGTGQDADWAWQEMTVDPNDASKFTYENAWGGVGCNINVAADDGSAKWYPEADIEGAAGLTVGDAVVFTFISTDGKEGALSVAKK